MYFHDYCVISRYLLPLFVIVLSLLLLFEISLFVLFQRGRYVTESAAERIISFDFRG